MNFKINQHNDKQTCCISIHRQQTSALKAKLIHPAILLVLTGQCLSVVTNTVTTSVFLLHDEIHTSNVPINITGTYFLNITEYLMSSWDESKLLPVRNTLLILQEK